MKLSAFLCSYGHLFEKGESLKSVIDRAHADGFSAVEPFPMDGLRTEREAADIGAYVRDQGMDISCYSACCELMKGTEEDALRTLKNEINIAAAMGSPYFHHTIHPPLVLPGRNDISFPDALKRAAVILKQSCSYASDKGVICVFEDQGMYFNGLRGMHALMEALGDTQYGLVADLGNILFVDEKPEDYIAEFSRKIFHVHCKDYLMKPGGMSAPGSGWYITKHGNFLRDTIVGHGVVDYAKVMRVLKRIQYDGWYSLEYGAPERAEYGIRASVENLKQFEEVQRAERIAEPFFHGVYPVFDEV